MRMVDVPSSEAARAAVQAVLVRATECLIAANACFEEAAASADLAEMLALTRRGQALCDEAERLRRQA
jgi:hypothetical protein